jgi:Mg-chelatase subunit ChlD
MSRWSWFACLILGLGALAPLGSVRAQEPVKKDAKPQVEVVFCLDTTGSMGGLIQAAKQKIWAISNQIAGGKPTPNLKIGLVAYRDRGDAYVTKVIDLTDDLDAIHGHLMGFQAQGGGDAPESVNQALHESVTKIGWSKDKKTLKIIFLVGDAPPHMDYADDVKYHDTCKLAMTKDIIINTIQCGRDAQCQKYWQDICRLAEGSYVQIDQQGGPIVTVATPFDADLAKLNSELSSTVLVFGTRAEQVTNLRALGGAKGLPAPAAADRAAAQATLQRGGTSYDLLKNLQDGKVKLETLKKEELPAELRELTLEQQKEYLAKLEKRRNELSEKAIELNKKRTEFIAKKQAEDARNPGRDSFDGQVLRILQRQAARSDIQYAVPDEKKR